MTYNFILDQEKLDILCQERELITREIFSPNDYYGQAEILKSYVGLPNSYALKIVLQHGLDFSNLIWDAESSAKLPIFLPPSFHRAAIYREKTSKPSIPIGFGFLYAIQQFHEQYGQTIDCSERHGTIVFPSHSTHHITAMFDFEDYAQTLENLPEKYKPIVICMYWKDFLLGHHLEYTKRGFKVVTAGHMYDPMFMLRLYDICRQFKYSTSNDIGTHLFASVKSGCCFFYAGVSDVSYENPQEAPLDLTSEFYQIKQQSLMLFSRPSDRMNHDQYAFVDSHMGTQNFRSKNAMRLIFFYAELCDKLYMRCLSGKEILDKMPTYIQRKVEVIKVKLYKMIHQSALSILK
jgi:hypothetical protein